MNEQRNSILVIHYYQDLGGTSDRLKPIFSQSEARGGGGGGGGGCCFISMEFLCLFLGSQLIGNYPGGLAKRLAVFSG